MELGEAREHYYEHSRTASTIVRQLAFAGVAIIWVFRRDSHLGTILLDRDLFLAGFLLVMGLGADALQYVGSSAFWGVFSRFQEWKHGEEVTFEVPRWINWWAITFFIAKILFVMSAYVLLGITLMNKYIRAN